MIAKSEDKYTEQRIFFKKQIILFVIFLLFFPAPCFSGFVKLNGVIIPSVFYLIFFFTSKIKMMELIWPINFILYLNIGYFISILITHIIYLSNNKVMRMKIYIGIIAASITFSLMPMYHLRQDNNLNIITLLIQLKKEGPAHPNYDWLFFYAFRNPK